MSDYITEIQAAFLKLHGCDAEYIETVPVVEEFQGETVWQGEVEVFELKRSSESDTRLRMGIRRQRRRRATLLHCVGVAAR